METVTGDSFTEWAAAGGIGFDECFPESRCLTFLHTPEYARFWVLPLYPETWPHFIASILSGLDDWGDGTLWPRSGAWPELTQSQSHNEGVRSVILRGAGIPDGWAGAARFAASEDDALIAVIYSSLAFGWCVDDDLFFIPDHRKQLLQTDHHDVIHVSCLSEERVLRLVDHMAEAGYELPRELPDWTFKRPVWMDELGTPVPGQSQILPRSPAPPD